MGEHEMTKNGVVHGHMFKHMRGKRKENGKTGRQGRQKVQKHKASGTSVALLTVSVPLSTKSKSKLPSG